MKMKPQMTLLLLCFPLTLATEAVQEFTAGNNLFTASVYTQLAQTAANFLVSPFSAETALALTQSGAKDQTAEEIRTALHLPDSQQKIQDAVKSLQPSLRKNELYTLKTANKIYLKDDFEVKDEFRKIASEVFGADLEKIDFEKRDEAVTTMNRWVEERTEHKIRNLVARDSLDDRTRSVLVNALYFRGNWTSPFEMYATRREDFFKNAEKEAVQVDTMHDSGSRRLFESKDLDAKFLELPFEGDEVTLTVVLPNQIDGLAALEGKIEEVLKAPEYTNEYVRVSLPKFKIESQIDFKEVLQKLGVKKAFKDDEADLSGIAGEKGDLIIDKVIQKTFVDVTEEGVEAAAATFAVVGVPLSGFFPISPPKEFKADHPFIFYIKAKDLVLFAGRVVDPSLV